MVVSDFYIKLWTLGASLHWNCWRCAPGGICIYLYPKLSLLCNLQRLRRSTGRRGEWGKQGIRLWPFFPLLKPKGNSELNGLCLRKRPAEGQRAVKIQWKGLWRGFLLCRVCLWNSFLEFVQSGYSRRPGPCSVLLLLLNPCLLSSRCREGGNAFRDPKK